MSGGRAEPVEYIKEFNFTVCTSSSYTMNSTYIEMNIAQKFQRISITTDTVIIRVPTNKEPIVLVFSQQQHQEDPFITCGPFNPNLPWDVVDCMIIMYLKLF